MKKTALLFPGQGSQYVGMGKEIFYKYKIAQDIFNEANDILGFDLKNLCFNGDSNELMKTENTQPALLTYSVAIFRVLMDKYDISPSFYAGHSLGEISALVCAGGLSFSDGLNLVRKRGLLMKEISREGLGTMTAIIGAKWRIVEEECLKESEKQRQVVISNYNSPEELVISGTKESVMKVGKRLSEKGAIVVPLRVSAPFHSPFMREVAIKFKEELKNYKFTNVSYPVISNIDARLYYEKEEMIDRLAGQIINPVLWTKVIKVLEKEGVEVTIELGGKNILKRLVLKNTDTIESYAINEFEKKGEFKLNIF